MVSRWIALAGLMLVALPACDGGGEGSDGGSDDGGGGSCYPYLLLQDHETGGGNGLDLDAVAVFDATMTLRGYADQWGEVAFGPGQDGACSDANAALGVEDGSAVCLGGEGGYLIVSFAGVDCIAEGDLIQTFELGTEAEPYDLLVGPTASATDVNWVVCASDASGPTQCTVPALPQL